MNVMLLRCSVMLLTPAEGLQTDWGPPNGCDAPGQHGCNHVQGRRLQLAEACAPLVSTALFVVPPLNGKFGRAHWTCLATGVTCVCTCPCLQVLQQRKQGLAKLLELNSPEELLRVLQVQPSILHKRTDTLDGEYCRHYLYC